MDDITRNRIETADAVEQWFADHAAGVAANTKLKTTKNNFVAKLTQLRDNVGEQAGAVSEAKEQTDVKGGSRENCVTIAKKVNRSAKAAEIEQPGIETRYPYPRNLNDEALVALLRSFAIGGADDDAIIAGYGAPVDWVQQCTDNADAFEAVTQLQSQATGEKVGKRALTLALVDDLMQLIRTAGYIIENTFENDVAALASWKSASHVKTKKYTPPPPTPPTP